MANDCAPVAGRAVCCAELGALAVNVLVMTAGMQQLQIVDAAAVFDGVVAVASLDR